ncbi:chromodomain y-like 2 [Moniliophthora roreri]|uniref:Chromo domain-containing protein n=1 Tax=Moniliophthora roreri TaxID=221103 RepID=A0A0W0FYE3_MONRR|nr:chromodomain y-like 2 [Moniliophthora roreri]
MPSFSRESTPTLTTRDGQILYEVELIVAARIDETGAWEYYVKWTDYSWQESTWEPEESMLLCDEALDDFWGTIGPEVRHQADKYRIGKHFIIPDEEIDQHRPFSPVTKRSPGFIPKEIKKLTIKIMPPEKRKLLLKRNRSPSPGGYETGSTTEIEGEGDSDDEDDLKNFKPSARLNHSSCKDRQAGKLSASKKMKVTNTAGGPYPAAHQYNPVCGSSLLTKAELFRRRGYRLQVPEDQARHFLDEFINPPPRYQEQQQDDEIHYVDSLPFPSELSQAVGAESASHEDFEQDEYSREEIAPLHLAGIDNGNEHLASPLEYVPSPQLAYPEAEALDHQGVEQDDFIAPRGFAGGVAADEISLLQMAINGRTLNVESDDPDYVLVYPPMLPDTDDAEDMNEVSSQLLNVCEMMFSDGATVHI